MLQGAGGEYNTLSIYLLGFLRNARSWVPVVLKGTLTGEGIDEEAVGFGRAVHRVRERVCHMCAGVEGEYNTLSRDLGFKGTLCRESHSSVDADSIR